MLGVCQKIRRTSQGKLTTTQKCALGKGKFGKKRYLRPKKSIFYKVSASMQTHEIRWSASRWSRFLRDGFPIYTTNEALRIIVMYSDASDLGFGGIIGGPTGALDAWYTRPHASVCCCA